MRIGDSEETSGRLPTNDDIGVAPLRLPLSDDRNSYMPI